MVWAVINILKLSPTFFVSEIRHLHRWRYCWTHKWTDKVSISGTSFISVFSLTIFTHREGLSGSTPVPDNNVNSSTIPNQCAVQQGIYGVTSRVFILVLLGKDYDERATHRRLLRCHFEVCGGITISSWLTIWNDWPFQFEIIDYELEVKYCNSSLMWRLYASFVSFIKQKNFFHGSVWSTYGYSNGSTSP